MVEKLKGSAVDVEWRRRRLEGWRDTIFACMRRDGVMELVRDGVGPLQVDPLVAAFAPSQPTAGQRVAAIQAGDA